MSFTEPIRVTSDESVPTTEVAAGVWQAELVRPENGSELALTAETLTARAVLEIHANDDDMLLFAYRGSGVVKDQTERSEIRNGTATIIRAGEIFLLEAGQHGLSIITSTVGPKCDRHAPMGEQARHCQLGAVAEGEATGSRTFQILFGPHNGSNRATMFVGYVPPGKASWHYHCYDEIVWILAGSGRYQLSDSSHHIAPGSAFRVRAREVHIVENTSAESELILVGIFTPAGSPAAAYLA